MDCARSSKLHSPDGPRTPNPGEISGLVPLQMLGANDQALGGEKAVNLGVMMRRGFPVPNGFVVTTEAYRYFLSSCGVPPVDAPERIRTCLAESAFPTILSTQIYASHAALIQQYDGDMVCAVRSSATVEDSADASFAGQHATFYYVGEAQLLEMIKACWMSLWNDAALSYRRTQGYDSNSVEMAVIVQRMVPAAVSGVLFTNNPVSGNANEMVIESSWGMGASIVDGRVSPDRFVIARDSGRCVECVVGDKKFMVPASRQKAGQQRMQEVAPAQRKTLTLSRADIESLVCWARKAERVFAQPQDLEWAIADGALFILQSRPITQMGAAPPLTSVKGKYVLFKPLVENFSAPLTPLAADLLSRVPMPGARMIDGWMYLNLRWVRAFVPWKLSDQQLAELIYLSGPAPTRLPIASHKVVLLVLMVMVSYPLFGLFAARTRNMPDDFMHGFRERVAVLASDANIDALEVIRQLAVQTRFFEPIGNLVLHINISCARYFLYLFALKLVLKRWAPDLGDDALSILCSGVQGMMSTDMGARMWRLSRTAQSNDQVREILTTRAPSDALQVLNDLPQAAPFLVELNEFLNLHGHRGIKELELSSPRWEQDPTPVIAMVKNLLAVRTPPSERQSAAQLRRSELHQALVEKLRTRWLETLTSVRYRVVALLIREAQYFTGLRENSRFYHTLGFALVRKKILNMETRLIAEKKLRRKDDIFYLKWRELVELKSGALGWRNIEERIRTRRRHHIRLAKRGAPKTIGFAGRCEPLAADATRLSGQTASPGSYEGRARIILDPTNDANLQPGEILVAPYTDPAWTPLFLTANAAVVEVGSYLSHAGTIAREYGMPCIVDVPGCTTRINTGDLLRVDGGAGVVWILEPAGQQ